MKSFVTAALIALSVVMLACGGGTSRPQPTPDAAQLLREGGASMASLKSLSATLKVDKGTISLQGFTLTGAKARIRLPADSDTEYTVKQGDLSFSIEVITLGGHVFVHLPFLVWREATGSEATIYPDLAHLFDATSGLPAVIPAGANPRYVGADQVDGVTAYHVTTTYTGRQVSAMLPELGSTTDVKADVWVDAGDKRIRKAILDGAFGDGGKEAAVEVDIGGFDSPVSITTPTP